MTLKMMIYTTHSGFSLTNYFIFVFIIILLFSWFKTRNLPYVACLAIFGVYILFLADKTLFPIHISGNFADMMKSVPFTSQINLIPFNFRNPSEMSYIVRELVLNIILLIPFGFGIRFIAPVKIRNIWWLALVVGSSIEVIQLIISIMIGYPYRVIDTTDVIMNTLGFLIGYGIFRLLLYIMSPVRRLPD